MWAVLCNNPGMCQFQTTFVSRVMFDSSSSLERIRFRGAFLTCVALSQRSE